MTTLSPFNFDHLSVVVDLHGEDYVETGVAEGESLAAAQAKTFGGVPLFGRLVGVECQPEVSLACGERFRGDGRVEIYTGSSPDLLPELMRPDRRTVFFLDAHWEPHPGRFDPAHGFCPLLAELRAVTAVDWKHKPTIMIDDYCMFCSKRWWLGADDDRRSHVNEYPRFEDIFDALGGCDYKFDFLCRGGILYFF